MSGFEWEENVDGYGDEYCWRGGVFMEIVLKTPGNWTVFVCDGKVGQFDDKEDARRFAEKEGFKMAIQNKEAWSL